MLRTIVALSALVASAHGASLQARTPLLALRGGSYPPPKAGYHALAAKGAAVSKQEPLPNLLSGALAGCYVAFGAVVALSIASAMPGISAENPGIQKLVFGALFPIALINIVAMGNQLFTGNTASVAAAVFEGLIEPSALIRNWVVTYAGNFIGSLAFLSMFEYTGLLSGSTGAMVSKIATTKCASAFGPTVVKGILANWLVCLAAFMATCETDLAGKIIGIWFPISAFVMCGFEHSIANHFLVPAGKAAGAAISWSDIMMKNIVPVTIGNIIAGTVVFAGSYSYLYGALGGNDKD